MSTITADEFVHMTMAFADHMVKAAVMAQGPFFVPYMQARDELRSHLIDSVAALGLEAFCNGVAYADAADKAAEGAGPMQSLSLHNQPE